MAIRTSKWTLILGVVICGVASNSHTLDPSLAIRHIAWCAVTLILAGCVFLQKKKDLGVLQTSIFIVFAIYCVMSSLSIFTATNRAESLYFVLTAWVSLIFLVCAVLCIDKKTIMRAMVFMGVVFAIYSLYDITKASMGKGILATPGLGFAHGRNLWSSTLLLLLPFSLYLAFKNKGQIAILTTILLVVNVVLLQTRSVYAGLIIASMVCLFSWKKRTIVLLITGTIACVLVFDRLQNTGSLQHRYQSWGRTIKTFCDEPILGVGAGNWKIATPRYGNSYGDRQQFHQRAHNDYLETLTEVGLLGGVCYISIFCIALYYTWHMRDKVLAWTMRFGVISYMVFAFFSFPKERALHSMIVFIIIALIIKDHSKRKEWSLCRNTKTFVACMVIILCALCVNYYRYQSEIYYRHIESARRRGEWKKILTLIDENYSPLANMVGYSVTPMMYFRGEANYILGNDIEAMKDFERANKIHPNHPAILANLGHYNFKFKQYKKAQYYYSKANRIMPNLDLIEKPLGKLNIICGVALCQY